MTRAKLARTIVKKLVIVLIAGGLMLTCLFISNRPVASQTLPSVSAEVRNMRSRIARVEAEVRNLRSATSRNIRPNQNSRPRTVIASPPGLNTRSRNNRNQIDEPDIQSSDPMFKRLATLVIELKKEVRDLDKRLEMLEQN